MLAATEAAAVDERLPLDALGDRAVAREISPAAVRLFLRLADIWTLTVDQRRALLLVALEGMTLAEAAAALDIPEGTLVSRLGRARAALREMTGRETPRERRQGR